MVVSFTINWVKSKWKGIGIMHRAPNWHWQIMKSIEWDQNMSNTSTVCIVFGSLDDFAMPSYLKHQTVKFHFMVLNLDARRIAILNTIQNYLEKSKTNATWIHLTWKFHSMAQLSNRLFLILSYKLTFRHNSSSFFFFF